MKTVPTYTKILTLGASYTENALIGEVTIQEKVDGSQFSFGLNEDGEIVARSKSVNFHKDSPWPDMFNAAMEYVMSIEEKIKSQLPKDTYFYCEYLQKPKHNTLKYARVPKNHIVIFDCLQYGKWLNRADLEHYATLLDMDAVPVVATGVFSVDDIKAIKMQQSFLGDEIMEGIVIKNYSQTVLLGGNIFPLFTKYVREDFKERHSIDWKVRQPKDTLEGWIKGFQSEARWTKAVIHAKEQNKLENSPRDIGMLLKKIQVDIEEEEKETIKNYLYKCYKEEIMRHATKGFPMWYKDKLLDNVKNPEKTE